MPLRFESIPLLLAALALTLLAAAIAGIRGISLPRSSQICLAGGMVLLSLAAGGAHWRRAREGEVVVMLDLSPSTRTASYRDRATMERRVQELLGGTRRRIVCFADEMKVDQPGAALVDMPCERTVFAPPPSEAVLLFTDGRFELPAGGPRTFVVIDPGLEETGDAAVSRLQIRGGDLVANVRVSGGARELSLEGSSATKPIRVEAGSMVVARPLRGASASAQFRAGDAWPENDGLWITAPPKATSEQWWVGADAPAGWRAMEAGGLPTSASAYLAPAAIVLNNVPAAALGASEPLLSQYVRDLGGTLVILGGDHAFAAGDYGENVLEQLSPLSSYPPRPATQWIVLVDGSGSMGEATADGTRWRSASAAVKQLLPHLPPEDIATVGSFAEGVTWWSGGKSVRETLGTAIPPPELSPRGPTNLERAMVEVARSATGEMPKQFIIVTDADAQIAGPEKIAVEMKGKRISLHVLAIGNGSGLDALRRIAGATGGSVRSVLEAKAWQAGLLELGRAAMAARVETSPLAVRFLPPLALESRNATPWNRHWIKSSATALAEAKLGDEALNPAAEWRLGAGQVVAVAFATLPSEATALAAVYARPPRDPRFAVTWDAGSRLRVSVDAVDGKRAMNGEAITLELRPSAGGESPTIQTVPQTGPGMYEITLPAPRAAIFAAVRHGGRLLDQIAVPGRYLPEFDEVGNDHAAMHELARRTGGAVIDTRQTKPIDFRWPRRDVPLGSWLAAAGAVLIAIGLMGRG